MRNLLRTFVFTIGAAAVLAGGAPAQAAQLDGSLALAGLGVTQNGANLAVSTLINSTGSITTDVGMDDYSPVPAGVSFGATSLDLSSLTGNFIDNIASFVLSHATYGSFAAASGQILQRNASFLDVFILGTFTPGPGLAGFDPTPTSLRISINQSGQSVSEAITLNSPPVRVPEPATAALMLLGAFGAVGLRRRQIGVRGLSATR